MDLDADRNAIAGILIIVILLPVFVNAILDGLEPAVNRVRYHTCSYLLLAGCWLYVLSQLRINFCCSVSSTRLYTENIRAAYMKCSK